MDVNISQTLGRFSVAMDSVVTDLQRTVAYNLGSVLSQMESGLQNIALLVVSTTEESAT